MIQSKDMTARVAIIEDEMLVACHFEGVIEELGFEPVGIAADTEQARALAAAKPDIALVDLNLRDGLTGPEIGRYLGSRGVSVVFVTANPAEVSPPIPGALGVVVKPCDSECLQSMLRYATSVRAGEPVAPPPSLQVF